MSAEVLSPENFAISVNIPKFLLEWQNAAKCCDNRIILLTRIFDVLRTVC